MTILIIKVLDAAGAELTGVAVKVSGIDALQTNAQGMVQFLIDDASALEVSIEGKPCWSGQASALARREVFRQTATGFERAGTPT